MTWHEMLASRSPLKGVYLSCVEVLLVGADADAGAGPRREQGAAESRPASVLVCHAFVVRALMRHFAAAPFEGTPLHADLADRSERSGARLANCGIVACLIERRAADGAVRIIDAARVLVDVSVASSDGSACGGSDRRTAPNHARPPGVSTQGSPPQSHPLP